MVKEITLYEAWSFLRQSPVINLEGHYIEPVVYELEDDYKNEFLSLSWSEVIDEEELDFCVTFAEGDNLKCLLEGNLITLVNTDGEEETIELFQKFYPQKGL
jgi:hypothetical protein